ncbi:carboxypeptidase-like regulatory domain-containing protein [Neolewinella lacunae]|uniref:Carboxypeptidase-like regulatory domain-containing protein n=1 Tax=Neolewinella lacunae TaxID=1517758 RepID=A0A923T9I9_9BACT|nr:carboxypeptidase-like regulatory domain-containing protein [Neolewinella lacunae]MBC6995113.1 carboxypeptidase-like regulatory domain-containing protein [Neolewinella lacunae]MDN3634063.1 carboxypeptidase-like regulatory domain-containing protein [Neolewinella lacunae]
MPSLLLLLLLFTTAFTQAQGTLSGTVTDAQTGEPLGFATVYLDGTSKGDVTDEAGRFTLANVVLPANLVISHLSYTNQVLALTADPGPLSIRMEARERVLAGVEVTDRNLRQKTLAEFKTLLLGADEWGEQSTFQNDNVLRFDRDYRPQTIQVHNERMRQLLLSAERSDGRWSADGSTYTFEEATNLQAVSNGPLTIRLPHLGYTLQMDLNHFEADYRSGSRTLLGTFFFAPSAKQNAQQRKNRERAYLGSAMHFARALLAGTLTENGFRVLEVSKDSTGRGEIVQDILLRDYLHPGEDGTWELRGLAGRSLAILYYADQQKRPLPPEKWRKQQPVQSRCFVQEDRCLLLAGGAFGDASLTFSGDMGSRGLAWLLPVDYVFGE